MVEISLLAFVVGALSLMYLYVFPNARQEAIEKKKADMIYSSDDLTSIAAPVVRLLHELKIDRVECSSDYVSFEVMKETFHTLTFEGARPEACNFRGRTIIAKGEVPKIIGDSEYVNKDRIEKEFKSVSRQLRVDQFNEMARRVRSAYPTMAKQLADKDASEESLRKYKEGVAASWKPGQSTTNPVATIKENQ